MRKGAFCWERISKPEEANRFLNTDIHGFKAATAGIADKSLSYWASRANGLAEESEPATAAIRSMGPEGVQALVRAFQTGHRS